MDTEIIKKEIQNAQQTVSQLREQLAHLQQPVVEVHLGHIIATMHQAAKNLDTTFEYDLGELSDDVMIWGGKYTPKRDTTLSNLFRQLSIAGFDCRIVKNDSDSYSLELRF